MSGNSSTKSLSERIQQYFDRANNLEDEHQAEELYTEWAPRNDATINHFGQYLAPQRIAEIVAREVSDRQCPILDLACGTGLLGLALGKLGFGNITGIDISAAMLREAAAKNCYKELVQANLKEPLQFRNAKFAVVATCGALTVGHLGSELMPTALDALTDGGLFVADVEWSTWVENGVRTTFLDFCAARKFEGLNAEPGHFYEAAVDEPWHGWFVSARRTLPAP